MKLLDYLLAEYEDLDERTARGLIMRGDVLVNDRPRTSPVSEVSEGSVRIRGSYIRTVSRGSEKLRPVITASGINCTGKICMDLGAADGGFTSVLLELGAEKVYAVDIGYGILADELRRNEQVVVLERTNARNLERRLVPEEVELVVGDLSFISWSAVLPSVTVLLADSAEMLLLVKPQFELAAAGKGDLLIDGVVTRPEIASDCLAGMFSTWQNNAAGVIAVYPAAIKGRSGNQEYFIHLKHGTLGVSEEEYSILVDSAVYGEKY